MRTRRRLRTALLGLCGVPLLAGCLSDEAGTGNGGDCESHYQLVADAPTLQALKAKLVSEYLPAARSARVVDQHDGKKVVSVLNRKDRIIMQVDVWQESGGSWTAQEWLQCID